ncbi:MAG: hypothetical protein AB7O57_08140 [Hyphomicrobiaceae bacterium]
MLMVPPPADPRTEAATMLRLLADSAEQGDLSPRAIGELARMIGAIIAEGDQEAAPRQGVPHLRVIEGGVRKA